MKFGLKKLAALLLAVALLASLSACALEEEAADSAYSEKDRAEVAAVVGGKYEITKGEVIDNYNSYISYLTMYESYGMSVPTTDADIETLQDTVVDELVSSKILLYEAELAGITLSEEDQADVDAQLEEEMLYWLDSFTSQAEGEGAADVDARAVELFNEALAQSGMNMDMDGYKAYMRTMLEEEAIKAALEESIKATATLDEADIMAYYDNLLATQKETYEETPAGYQTDAEGYEMNGGNPVVYTPEGYMRIKTITISPAGELGEAFTTLRTALDALEAEYGKLTLEDAAANAARLIEIKTEYEAKKAEADILYEDYIVDARVKANEAYAALQEGKSFNEVLEAYGEDDMFKTYPIFMEKGILMHKEEEATIDPQIVEAVLALEAGAYSEIIQLDDMFYIVMPVGDEPSGTTELADVYDEIKTLATAEKAESVWTAQQETWNNDTSLVVYHEDVYRDIGK